MRYLNCCFIISKQTLLNKFDDERIHEEDMVARTALMDFLANKIAPFGEKVAAQHGVSASGEMNLRLRTRTARAAAVETSRGASTSSA